VEWKLVTGRYSATVGTAMKRWSLKWFLRILFLMMILGLLGTNEDFRWNRRQGALGGPPKGNGRGRAHVRQPEFVWNSVIVGLTFGQVSLDANDVQSHVSAFVRRENTVFTLIFRRGHDDGLWMMFLLELCVFVRDLMVVFYD
jgi:hypothetical protein